jgi:predicted transglutaminase-like cysteine proteinase
MKRSTKQIIGYGLAVGLSLAAWAVAFAVFAQTKADMDTLRQVNDRVNGGIRYVAQDASTDVLRIGAAEGDCDDYVVTKRFALLSAGFAPERLTSPVVSYRGQSHVVLVVDRSWVLDNIERSVVSVDTARRYYRF